MIMLSGKVLALSLAQSWPVPQTRESSRQGVVSAGNTDKESVGKRV